MKDKLYLFTSRYPAGKAEGFIEPELEQLSFYYSEVHIFPLLPDKPAMTRKLPPNIMVHTPYEIASVGFSVSMFRLMGIFFGEWFRSKKKWAFLRHTRRNLLNLAQCYQRSLLFLTEHGDDLDNTDLYSFWMEDWATTLSFVKKKRPNICFVCRVHGYDLYNERRPDGYIPWRNFQLKNCSAVVAVSEAGKKYLSDHFPKYKERFWVSRLGISGPGAFVFEPAAGALKIVSCSAIIPLKRVTLLANFLTVVKFPVHWVHFGDGPEKEALQNLISAAGNSLLKVELKGQVNQQEILSFYAATPVDVFVHLSKTEGGVPLALQEAACFGIPLLACDAGGVNEIVNEKTGFLMPIDVDADTFFSYLEKIKHSACRNEMFRKGVREYWQKNFDLEQATQKLLSVLQNNPASINN